MGDTARRLKLLDVRQASCVVRDKLLGAFGKAETDNPTQSCTLTSASDLDSSQRNLNRITVPRQKNSPKPKQWKYSYPFYQAAWPFNAHADKKVD